MNTRECFDFTNNGLNLWSRTILPCKLQSNTRERWRERSLMRCCFRLEIAAEKGGLLAKRFGKALFVFLVARNKYSCLQNCVEWTFVFLSCPEFGILPKFLSGIFLFCFLVCFSTKICPKNSRENPAKSTIFSANLSLQIPWNFTFFPVNYQKPCSYVMITYMYYKNHPTEKWGKLSVQWLFQFLLLTQTHFLYCSELVMKPIPSWLLANSKFKLKRINVLIVKKNYF